MKYSVTKTTSRVDCAVKTVRFESGFVVVFEVKENPKRKVTNASWLHPEKATGRDIVESLYVLSGWGVGPADTLIKAAWDSLVALLWEKTYPEINAHGNGV